MATRTRTRPPVVVYGTWSNQARYKSNNGLRWTQSGQYVARSITDTMTDESTPNFRRLQADGKTFCKNMTKVVTEENVFLSSGVAEDLSYIYSGTADYVTQPNYVIPYIAAPSSRTADITALKEIAGTQAMARITSEEILLPATIGELKETLKTLRDAVFAAANIRKSLYRCYQWTKRGNRLARKKFAAERDAKIRAQLKSEGKTDRQISSAMLKKKIREYREGMTKAYLKAENAWMSARMGWRPFFYECQSLHRALTKVNDGTLRQTFRGKALEKEYNEINTYSKNMNGGTYQFIRTYTETINVKAGVLCQVRYSGFPDTFGLTKLPQTIWELTTLSWAVDYFFNVGELIAAMTPDTYWEPLQSWTTMKSLTVNKVAYSSRSVPTLTADYVRGGFKVRVTQEKTRTPGVSVGFNFSPRLNLAKYIDLTCVGRQQFSKTVKLLSKAITVRKGLKG